MARIQGVWEDTMGLGKSIGLGICDGHCGIIIDHVFTERGLQKLRNSYS